MGARPLRRDLERAGGEAVSRLAPILALVVLCGCRLHTDVAVLNDCYSLVGELSLATDDERLDQGGPDDRTALALLLSERARVCAIAFDSNPIPFFEAASDYLSAPPGATHPFVVEMWGAARAIIHQHQWRELRAVTRP